MKLNLLLFASLVLTGAAQAQPQTQEALALKPVLAEIRARQTTAETAWQNQKLSSEMIIEALASPELVNAGLAMQRGDTGLARSLAAVLLRHAPEVLERKSTLPMRSLLHIANYLAEKKDERSVPLYQEVLGRATKHNPQWDDTVDGAIYNLASYYHNTGQIEKAVQAQSQIFELSDNPGLLANYIGQIFWNYQKIGDSARTQNFLMSLEKSPFARVVADGRVMRAQRLFSEKKIDAGRALLLQPVNTKDASTVVEMRMLTVAQSFMDEGDLISAQKYVNLALDGWELLREKPTGGPLFYYHESAQRLANLVDDRLNKSFYWQSEDVEIWVSPPQPTQFHRLVLHLAATAPRDLEFSCDHPAVRLEAAIPDDKTPEQRVVFLNFDPAKFDPKIVKPNAKLEIVARARALPGQEARLPLQLFWPQDDAPMVVDNLVIDD